MNGREPSDHEILLYTTPDGAVRVEVGFEDETFWLTQKKMAELFGVGIPSVNRHLKEIYKSHELSEMATIRRIRIVQIEGGRQVALEVESYNLDAIIAVGYRVNSRQADNRNAEITQTFVKTVRNKLHWAITGKTAAELVAERASASQPNMGLKTWKNAPSGRILRSDVTVAKNYLAEDEIRALERIVSMYLDYAENQAARQVPMRMADWVAKLDAFLKFNEYDVLTNAGGVSHEVAQRLAERQYQAFQIIQDPNLEGDFEKATKKLLSRKRPATKRSKPG